jgi:hypothetical protein
MPEYKLTTSDLRELMRGTLQECVAALVKLEQSPDADGDYPGNWIARVDRQKTMVMVLHTPTETTLIGSMGDTDDEAITLRDSVYEALIADGCTVSPRKGGAFSRGDLEVT